MSGSRAATGGDGGKHSKNCATEWTGGARVLSETESEHIPGAARRSLGIRKIAEVGRRAQESPRPAPRRLPLALGAGASGSRTRLFRTKGHHLGVLRPDWHSGLPRPEIVTQRRPSPMGSEVTSK